jgi:hypothetical protein
VNLDWAIEALKQNNLKVYYDVSVKGEACEACGKSLDNAIEITIEDDEGDAIEFAFLGKDCFEKIKKRSRCEVSNDN